MEEKRTPTEPGLYLAKDRADRRWYNLLIFIYGTSPYLQWTVWDYDDNELSSVIDITFLYFGPKLARNTDREGLTPLDTHPT